MVNMSKKEQISSWIEEREGFIKIYNDSWDDDKSEYIMEEPFQIDHLADKIKESILKHRDELAVDFIIESLTYLGDAPQVIYDDNGHFAISGSGMSPVPMTESGVFEDTESFTAFVEPEQWKDTIREALNHYLDEE